MILISISEGREHDAVNVSSGNNVLCIYVLAFILKCKMPP